MDPRNSAQDVIRCDLCETPVPPLYCEICQINLCKVCVGEHLLNESKLHIVVPFKHRQSIPSYPKCQEHATKLCELHCEQCDIPVCVQCVSSKKHKTHDVVDILGYFEIKRKALQADLEEYGKFIYPVYQEIASSFSVHEANLNRNTEKLILAVNKRGEEWHREIDNIITKLIFDIKIQESSHLAFLNEQEKNINNSIIEITQVIGEVKKLLESIDGCLLLKYKSRTTEFKKFPPSFSLTLPSFSSQVIDKEQLLQQFGTLSVLCIEIEDIFYEYESSSEQWLPLTDDSLPSSSSEEDEEKEKNKEEKEESN